MRYFIFFGLLLSFALFEMGCNNGAPEQVSDDSDFVETPCDTTFREVSAPQAKLDSDEYAIFIHKVELPKWITNSTVTYFVVPVRHIDTLIKWQNEGKIMPNQSGDNPTWTMLALEHSGTDSFTIVPYFACYSTIDGNKQGPIVYFKLPERGEIDSIPTGAAVVNIKAMNIYIDKYLNSDEVFYPYGFQFPWSDLVGLSCSLQGEDPNNSLHGVLVLKDREDDNDKDKDRKDKEVDYYLHAFYKSKVAKSSKGRPGDGGDYFDFTSPCPNSCIP